MTTHEMEQALKQAEQTFRAADNNATLFAKMLHGRLRKVDRGYDGKVLARLKQELRDYNITTRKWKDEE